MSLQGADLAREIIKHKGKCPECSEPHMESSCATCPINGGTCGSSTDPENCARRVEVCRQWLSSHPFPAVEKTPEMIETAKRMLAQKSCDDIHCAECPVSQERGYESSCKSRIGSWPRFTPEGLAWLRAYIGEPAPASEPVKRFEVGRWYQWIGPKSRPGNWPGERHEICGGGLRNYVLAGKPMQCTVAEGSRAGFGPKEAGIAQHPESAWDWSMSLGCFREVPDPTADPMQIVTKAFAEGFRVLLDDMAASVLGPKVAAIPPYDPDDFPIVVTSPKGVNPRDYKRIFDE